MASELPSPLIFRLYNPHPHEALFSVVVHWGSLPEGTELHLALGRPEGDGGEIEFPFPHRIEDGCDEPIQVDNFRTYHLVTPPERRTELAEILIGADHRAVGLLHVVLPEKPQGRPPRFDLVQMDGRRVIGGSTFVVRG